MQEIAWLYWPIGGLLALAVGSFLNVMIYRLPLQLHEPHRAHNLWFPRSYCPGCKVSLRWRDNIPLLSWLLLRGKCRHCQRPISLRYPLVEAATAILSLLVMWRIPFTMPMFAALLLCWTLLTLAVIDMEHLLLPDALTLPLLWAGLLFKANGWIAGSLHDALWGAVGGYLTLWIFSISYQWIRGIDALGMGDAKLLAAVGAWLGWALIPFVLFIASAGGILFVFVSRIVWRRDLHHVIAFGPWIALASISLFIHSII